MYHNNVGLVSSKARTCRMIQVFPGKFDAACNGWLAVKELALSYYNKKPLYQLQTHTLVT